MKINKENMKWLAEKLDKVDARFPLALTPDDMCNMAYQLQYFFEAMEKIKACKYESPLILDVSTWMKCINMTLVILNNALIHKEDEYTLEA